MTSRLIQRTTLAGLATLASSAAWAHLTPDAVQHLHSADLASSFTQGLIHPLTGVDHLTAMISVGMWSVLGSPQARSLRAVWALPAAFALTMLVGASLGLAGLHVPGVEPMIAASLLVLGLLLAARTAVSTIWGSMLVAGFALFHGLAHGQELGGHALAALCGMTLATVSLHAIGIWLGQRLQAAARPKQQWMTRAAGLGVAGLGMSLMAPGLTALF